MEVGKILAGVFTAIGVLAVTALVLYLIAKAIGKYKPPQEPDFPSSRYMEKVGAKCPAGWIYKGETIDTQGGKHDVCQNVYNIPVCRDWIQTDDKPDGCYNGPGKIALFPRIDDWDQFLQSNIPDTARCQWVNRCGPPSEVASSGSGESSDTCSNIPPASWIGISERC